MSDSDLEKALRDSLRRVSPKEGFDQRVMARIEAEQSKRQRAGDTSSYPRTVGSAAAGGRGFSMQRRWVPLALAASIVVAVLAVREWREYEEQRAGLAARQQLMQALRVTGEKLDLAYRVVNTQ